MKLLERYSLQSGLKIGKQHLLEKFFPLPENPYIVLHASSGMGSKNYLYWNEVTQILHPILKANNVSLIQIGAAEDPSIIHCNHLQGKTSLHQTNYILRNALMLIGNDSFSAHRCGHIGVPVLTVFGPTSKDNHSPLEHTPNSIFLESHRNNNNPTFSSQEFQKTVDYIRPEEIINGVLKILGANIKFNRNSMYIGRHYPMSSLEWVPNSELSPQFMPNAPIICRPDWLNSIEPNNEQFIAQSLNGGRKMTILINSELHLGLINQFKQNIEALIIEISDKFSLEYVKHLKRIGVKCQFFSFAQGEELSNLRLKFFDYATIDSKKKRTKEHFVEESSKYLNKELDKNLTIGENWWYKSNKFILSNNKIYLSKFALTHDLPTENFENNAQTLIDDNLIWEEMDFFYFFEQKIN